MYFEIYKTYFIVDVIREKNLPMRCRIPSNLGMMVSIFKLQAFDQRLVGLWRNGYYTIRCFSYTPQRCVLDFSRLKNLNLFKVVVANTKALDCSFLCYVYGA